MYKSRNAITKTNVPPSNFFFSLVESSKPPAGRFIHYLPDQPLPHCSQLTSLYTTAFLHRPPLVSAKSNVPIQKQAISVRPPQSRRYRVSVPRPPLSRQARLNSDLRLTCDAYRPRLLEMVNSPTWIRTNFRKELDTCNTCS
ncbi:uncharacterized protein PV07_01866 [Cladophialophora immunda]|uniref:Uncharacterized protein n=1 Tax=Cladophialophora immunda TaxID=569365 RepID=A0A0D2A4B6_9EURO|nr:uncharacterized protein PV07_01866 [Cladophialophora immunda]KIW35151.1 hypothetical protein PV07_01866 [Cladophialophora immunda]